MAFGIANFVADVAGAEGVGIPAILARAEAETVSRRAATLHDVRQIILSESGTPHLRPCGRHLGAS